MIVKNKSSYEVKSKKGKNLGKAKTYAGAKKRLAEVEMFKRKGKRG